MNIIKIDFTPSTNSILKKLSEEQLLPEGTVVQAYAQTAGRGQSGSSWEADPGKNITCSMLFYPSFLPVKQSFLLSEVIALGVKETLEQYIYPVVIKWPNDIYIDESKITGILIENELNGTEIVKSIAGIGVNINQELFRGGAPNPISLKQILGREIDPDILLKEMVGRILSWYNLLKQGSYHFIAETYRNSLYRKSGLYYYRDKNGKFLAEIDGVDDNGMLHLKTSQGEFKSYFFKEVSFVK